SLILKDIQKLEEIGAWERSGKVIEECLKEFEKIGYYFPLDEIHFALLLGDKTSNEMKMVSGYSGFAGIPGYMQVFICPNDYT
ncbi:hypothetical protein OSK38_29005, partial [Escherichia coli]|nr:hypothetical protein [Escherichia coli]